MPNQCYEAHHKICKLRYGTPGYGKNLRRLREKFGLSQEKLCAELQCRNCDIGRSTYAKYENGELNIRISVLMELKKIYNCSYDEFFDDLDSH